MYPGHGAPYRFDFPEARAGLERIRKFIKDPVIVQHPDGGAASIQGYADGVWLAFGQIAQGLWLHIQMTSDEVVKQALDRLMCAICGFEVRAHRGWESRFPPGSATAGSNRQPRKRAHQRGVPPGFQAARNFSLAASALGGISGPPTELMIQSGIDGPE